MFIKKHSIQHLIESISLPEHLKRHIELKRSGSNWLGLCPFHQDTTPSFYVYPNNYHCFACNAHGSVLDYEIHRAGLSFKESVEQLASSYNYNLEYEENTLNEKQTNFKQIQSAKLFLLNKIKQKFKTLFSLNPSEFPLDSIRKDKHQSNFPPQSDINISDIFSHEEIKILNTFSYSQEALKRSFYLPQFINSHFIFPLEKENKELYGFVFLQLENDIKIPSMDEKFINCLNKIFSPTSATNPILSFFTLHKNYLPCLNWNEARPLALKQKQIIVVFNLFDAYLLSQKNIHHVVVCPEGLDVNLFHIFSKRVKEILIINSNPKEDQADLFNLFKISLENLEVSVDVLFLPHEQEKRIEFFGHLSEEKMKIWFKSAEKIYIKTTELMLSNLTKGENKLHSFKEKIYPYINQIKEHSIRDAIILDIKNKFFYSDNFSAPYQKPNLSSLNLTNLSRETKEKHVIATINIPKPHNETPKSQIEIQTSEENKELIELTRRTAQFYHKMLLQTEKHGGEEISYLKSRGITSQQMARWKIGFSSSQHDLAKKSQTGLVSQENLLKLGLIKKTKFGSQYYDFFHDRIIIPIANHQGEIVALSGRILPSKDQSSPSYSIPKYINSPESEIFSKSKILFNFYDALESIISNQYVLVVEGYMDCISLVNAGIQNVVAVMGTALTSFHLTELAKLTNRIVLCFDNDKAGQSAARRSFAASVRFLNIKIESLSLPMCKDPDEYIKKFGKQEFLNLIQSQQIFLYEKICAWCQSNSKDYQDFLSLLQKEFECLRDSENNLLIKQVEQSIFDKYNLSLKDFFSHQKTSLLTKTASPQQEINNIVWTVKNPLEMKLLMSLLYLKFSELPTQLQNILLNLSSENENDEKICAQAIEHEFSKTGFQVFLEISSWMSENQHISVTYMGFEPFEVFSRESQILIAFVLSDVKNLMRFNIQELIKENLSGSISMVTCENVWNLKNVGFLKFNLRNITLAFQNKVLPNLFAEALLNLEVDYIDSTLKACSSLHFDNDLDSQIQFYITERGRCKAQLNHLSLK